MDHIKRGGRLLLPCLLIPLAFLIYAPLNSCFFAGWLGCSCPVLNERGELVPRAFSANHLTLLVSVVFAAAAVVLALCNWRRLPRGTGRLAYVVVCLLFIAAAAYGFVALQYLR